MYLALSCYDLPSKHWTCTCVSNVLERLNREIRRRTRVVGSFLNSSSTLMLVCTQLHHVASPQRGNKKYMNVKHLEATFEDTSIAS